MEMLCESGGERLDVWLSGALPGHSRSAVQKLIADGRATVNGARSANGYRLKKGDSVEVNEPPEPPSPAFAAQDIRLDIVYEDDYIIVIDKPAGMVTHPGSGNRDGTLANALAFHCAASLSDAGGAFRPGIVHRLDKDTSGLIVAAKTNEAHYKLAAEFRERRVRKVYDAIVRGRVAQDAGRIEMPIGRHATDRKRMAVLPEGGRDATTLFRVVMRLPCDCTWLEAEIPTGRTHQIRVHLAQIGHPVAGDQVYGRGSRGVKCPEHNACGLMFSETGNNMDNRRASGISGASGAPEATTPRCPLPSQPRGQLLNATRLEFNHPVTGGHMAFNSRTPWYLPQRK